MTNFAAVFRYNNSMHYTVYLDLLFLVNFTVDLWILLLEKKLLGFRASGQRLTMGAAVGGAWVCFLVLVPLPPFWEQALSFLAVAGVIQWVAFSVHSAKTLAKTAVVFYFFAFLFGGIFSAVAERTGGIPASLLLPAVTVDEMRLGERVLPWPVIAFSRYPVSGNNRYQIIIHSQEALP